MGFGIYSFSSKKPVGFWANIEVSEVRDVHGYNQAVGKLWIGFSIWFIIVGLPLLIGQNTPYIIISVLGVVLGVIVIMVVYLQVIEMKYRKG